MTSGDIMNDAAVLLNDAARSNFTYTVQIPYLNMAQNELQELMEENNVPVTNELSLVLTFPAGSTVINSASTPPLPDDLIEIQEVFERLSGTTNDFIPVTKVDFLPKFSTLVTSLQWWAWYDQAINFLGATSDRDIQINYIKSVFTPITDENGTITVFNSKLFLTFRTAALIAEFVGENKSRADDLNASAGMALERNLNISTKGRQAIATRRRPFMASYRGGYRY